MLSIVNVKTYYLNWLGTYSAKFEKRVRTKSWTTIGLRKEPFMYSKEQKDMALQIYHQTRSVTKTIKILGYPTHRNLYTWILEENAHPYIPGKPI